MNKNYLLLPFSWLYGLIVSLRNWLFDKEIVKSTSFQMPLIGIGNLSAGGTGKTPMAEYVLGLLLENGYKPALLSRGYKRKTKGFLVVKPMASAAHVGDEPYQIKRKFEDVVVAVCEERVEGVKRIMEAYPEVDVIVLDDSYQHRSLKAGLNILLTDHSKPYYKDAVLPAGMLREPESGKNRADMIIMTKCPTIPGAGEKAKLTAELKPLPHQQVYFTCINYKSLVKVHEDSSETTGFPASNLKGYRVLLFTGIANPKPLKDYLSDIGAYLSILSFPDHHSFSKGDIQKILDRWASITDRNKLLVTTEKDWRRMENTPEAELLKGLPVYFLPIGVEWDREEKLSFDEKILKYVETHTRNR